MKKSPVSSALLFAASYNADWIYQSLPDKRASVLDVGCGDGTIAALLKASDIAVTAIDTNAESVNKARQKGIKASVQSLLDFEHSPFDVVFVSRSLHHMPQLILSVKKLKELTKPDGLLLIDDFGFERIDARSAAWMQKQVKMMRLSGLLSGERHKWLLETEDLKPEEACLYWREKHWQKHDLLTSAAMKKELTAVMRPIFYQECPNLFRFLCDLLPQTPQGAEEAAKLLASEQQMIVNEQMAANGFRLILKNSAH